MFQHTQNFPLPFSTWVPRCCCFQRFHPLISLHLFSWPIFVSQQRDENIRLEAPTILSLFPAAPWFFYFPNVVLFLLFVHVNCLKGLFIEFVEFQSHYSSGWISISVYRGSCYSTTCSDAWWLLEVMVLDLMLFTMWLYVCDVIDSCSEIGPSTRLRPILFSFVQSSVQVSKAEKLETGSKVGFGYLCIGFVTWALNLKDR